MTTAEYNRKWEAAHREYRKEYKRNWRKAHPDAGKVYLRKWRAEHPGETAERCKKYRLLHPGRTYKSLRKWMLANPEKWKAQRVVYRAITTGKLIRQVCQVCSDPKTQAHHPDYSKPLDVKWLCRPCHEKQHHEPLWNPQN